MDALEGEESGRVEEGTLLYRVLKGKRQRRAEQRPGLSVSASGGCAEVGYRGDRMGED